MLGICVLCAAGACVYGGTYYGRATRQMTYIRLEYSGGMNMEPREEIVITREQLRILRDGLCVWNTIVLDSLTERGRAKLYNAQDLVERLWNNKQEGA